MKARRSRLTSNRVMRLKQSAIIFACSVGRQKTIARRSTSTRSSNFLSSKKSTAATRRSISTNVFGNSAAATRLKALGEEFAKIEKWDFQTLESALKSLAQKLGCKTGDLVHPARVAVSGRSVGPSLYHMLEVMGKERVLKRFDRMMAQLGAK